VAAPAGAEPESSATAPTVPFTPVASTGGGGGGSGVSFGTIVAWYVLAMAVGTVAAGIAWARSNGHLTPAALVARVRRRT
jgi:hypothetical protein